MKMTNAIHQFTVAVCMRGCGGGVFLCDILI